MLVHGQKHAKADGLCRFETCTAAPAPENSSTYWSYNHETQVEAALVYGMVMASLIRWRQANNQI